MVTTLPVSPDSNTGGPVSSKSAVAQPLETVCFVHSFHMFCALPGLGHTLGVKGSRKARLPRAKTR